MKNKSENYPYISYELSKLAKEAGFDEPCTAVYEENAFTEGGEVTFIPANLEWTVERLKEGIEWLEKYKRPGLFNAKTKNSTIPQFLITAPTYQQIVDWLREEKGYPLTIEYEKYEGSDHYIITSPISVSQDVEYYPALDTTLSILLYTIANPKEKKDESNSSRS